MSGTKIFLVTFSYILLCAILYHYIDVYPGTIRYARVVSYSIKVKNIMEYKNERYVGIPRVRMMTNGQIADLAIGDICEHTSHHNALNCIESIYPIDSIISGHLRINSKTYLLEFVKYSSNEVYDFVLSVTLLFVFLIYVISAVE